MDLMAAGGTVFFVALLAAFVDSTCGGGGLISLPSLLILGIPPHLALGTNKIIGITASTTSTLTYALSKTLPNLTWHLVLPISILGAALGAGSSLLVPAHALKPLLSVLLILALLTSLFARQLPPIKSQTIWVALIFAFGFYDGFFGPGTGLFFTMLCLAKGLTKLASAASARLLNWGSNLGALAIFGAAGALRLEPVLWGILGAALGAYLGSRNNIRTQGRWVPLAMRLVSLVLMGKLLADLFN